MKTAKRCMAILLSVVLMAGLLPCAAFADDSAPGELLCEDYHGNTTTYKNGGTLTIGDNAAAGLEEGAAYYFTFVPDQTCVYGFIGNVKGISADTDDNKCSAQAFEDLVTLYPDGEDSYTDFSYMTAGTTYFVLFDNYTGATVSYEGTVTDVDPSVPLVDLVKGWDVFVVDAGFFAEGRLLDVEMVVEFSTGKKASGTGFYFDPDEYTETTATWKHLGFEKTFTYNAVGIKDLITSVTPKDKVEFIRYYDGTPQFAAPVTLVITFSDGTSAEVVIEDYDYYYSFAASNGRCYTVYLDIDDEGTLAAWIAGSDFGSIDYKIKRVGFFRDLVRYLLQNSETIRFWCALFRVAADNNTKVQILLDCMREIGTRRIEFLKMQFARVL